MARCQEFNTQEALGKALHVFWRKGYKGASMNDLLDAMGIGKGSFYATFGNKRELFLTTLKRYGEEQALVCQASDILAKRPAKTAIAMFLGRAIDRAIDEKRCCMFGKTALEFWQSDPEVADKVSAGVKQVEEAFYQAILRGQQDGDINAEHNPKALAQFLTSTYYGLQVMASANPDRKALKGIVATSLVALS